MPCCLPSPRPPTDEVVHFTTLGFIGRVAKRIHTLQTCLIEPLCIPYALARLSLLDGEIKHATEVDRPIIEYLIERWWEVITQLSDQPWGVNCLLRCDITSLLRCLE